MIKELLRTIIKKLKHCKIWLHTVFLEHHNKKLSFYHKLRAIRYGFANDYYYMYHLEKNNPKEYISEYSRMISRDIINGKYKSVFDNKLIFEKVFGKDLSIPKTVMIIDKEIYDYDGNIISYNDIDKLLIDNKYIIKPCCDTGGGTGIKLLEKRSNNLFVLSEKEMTSKELYNEFQTKYKGYILVEFIKQHPYSEKINPTSVNTIRIVTLKDPKTKEIIIPFAVHRFGSKKSNVVDNASSGVYVTNIDVESGTLLETKSYLDTTTLDKHPDSNVLIKGTVIPHFDTIKKDILNIAKKYPYLPFIAWDIVVTEESFSVIEINASTGLGLFQIFGPINNSKLAELYREYKIIK